jgi:hypothetical protein
VGRKRSEPPEEMKKFLAIKLLEHLASNLVYSWDNIKPPMQLGERNPVVEQGMAKVLCLHVMAKMTRTLSFASSVQCRREKDVWEKWGYGSWVLTG